MTGCQGWATMSVLLISPEDKMGAIFGCNGLMNPAATERELAPRAPLPRRGALGGPCVLLRRTWESAHPGAAGVMEIVVYQWFTGS